MHSYGDSSGDIEILGTFTYARRTGRKKLAAKWDVRESSGFVMFT